MSTRQSNANKPIGASPHAGFPLPSIDVGYKYERGKHLSFEEQSEFRIVCKWGADQIVDCYGETMVSGQYHNVFDFIALCRGCPYANKYIDYKDLVCSREVSSIFSGSFVLKRLGEWIDYESPKAFIYFVSDGTFVKIGKANDILSRFNTLQTSNANELSVLSIIPCKNAASASMGEKELHRIYRDYRIRGEWFDVLKDITERNGVVSMFPSERWVEL